MTVASDLQQAAIDIFDALTGVPITASYVERSTTYVAGGDNVVSETPHVIRLIRDEKNELATAIASDAKSTDEKYLMVTSELPVDVNTKDQIEISSERFTIVDFSPDPVDAVTELLVRRT